MNEKREEKIIDIFVSIGEILRDISETMDRMDKRLKTISDSLKHMDTVV